MYLKIFYLIIGITITYAQDGYIFKNSIQNQYFDTESIIEQTFGPFTILTNFSARKISELIGQNEKTGEITIIDGWDNVIANDRFDDKVKPNHNVQNMNGARFKNIYDQKGIIISSTPLDDKSAMVQDQMNQSSLTDMFSDKNASLFYSLGGDTTRYVGDVWTIIIDTVLTSFNGFTDFSGTLKGKNSYIFKKIKEKRGDKIAYIDTKSELEVSGIGTFKNQDYPVEFTQVLIGGGKCQFNIDKGVFNKYKSDMRAIGAAKNLEDDTTNEYTINIMSSGKGKLK